LHDPYDGRLTVISNSLPVRRLILIGLVALAAGTAVAQADGGAAGASRAPQPPAALARQVAVAPTGQPVRLSVRCAPTARRRRATRTPPSDGLKNAFAILRRERTEQDALPARALRALKARGLDPVDPQSTRLLRADGAARAWVVPVPDVGEATALGCLRGAQGTARKPREGVAVVSLGGAPAGGGGALSDLQRGRAPVALDPCAGTGHNMLSVSGMVPDGVEAVFVTAADGTSTRADVRDNGYAFVLPRSRRVEQRYVVWSGSDGSPHVQPLPLVLLGGRVACARLKATVRVTPDPWSAGCLPDAAAAVAVAPRPPATRPRRLSGAARPRQLERLVRARRQRACSVLSPWTGRVLPGIPPQPPILVPPRPGPVPQRPAPQPPGVRPRRAVPRAPAAVPARPVVPAEPPAQRAPAAVPARPAVPAEPPAQRAPEPAPARPAVPARPRLDAPRGP
jgi:hypothetical protein